MKMNNLIKLTLFGFLVTGPSMTQNSSEMFTKGYASESKVIISDVVETENDDFSEEKLIQMLKDLNVKFPHIVLAQAKLETGHFKSNIFNENHNLFGMKEARVRIHTAKGTQHNHAYYDDWKESVYDYAFYQSTYHSDKKNERQYYRALDKSYAESKNYSDALKNIIERENLYELFLVK